jgi:hypothetical protein
MICAAICYIANDHSHSISRFFLVVLGYLEETLPPGPFFYSLSEVGVWRVSCWGDWIGSCIYASWQCFEMGLSCVLGWFCSV